ncbi:MAG: AhpC/TSA family protein [Chloroflexi bacterium]|nr:MAG: AhpC/TSA family protein [Chloroflexota bacterium]MBL1196993.1 AhpC/TSA family protein [Chloroflexota bacterium]NOH14288.1 redoxin domain-containing protein [Chloroflexota bacterium]
MDLPMHPDLKVGNKFPNFELPDHTGEMRKLSQLIRGFPTVLVFSRGYFCPKDRRQLQNYVDYLQPELRVNYCNMVTVSVDDQMLTTEVRDQLDANWTFLSDADRELLHELQMVDVTDPAHGEIYIPYTFVLDRDRTIYKIYNGWWYAGRPTVEELRMDFRALLSKRPDWAYKEPEREIA